MLCIIKESISPWYYTVHSLCPLSIMGRDSLYGMTVCGVSPAAALFCCAQTQQLCRFLECELM